MIRSPFRRAFIDPFNLATRWRKQECRRPVCRRRGRGKQYLAQIAGEVSGKSWKPTSDSAAKFAVFLRHIGMTRELVSGMTDSGHFFSFH